MQKFFISLALLVGGLTYTYNNLTPTKVITYAKQKRDPEWSPKLTYWVGVYLETRDRREEMVSTFTTLLEEYTTSCAYAPMARVKLGNAYYRMGERQKAQEQYQAYLDEHPEGEFKQIATKSLELLKN